MQWPKSSSGLHGWRCSTYTSTSVGTLVDAGELWVASLTTCPRIAVLFDVLLVTIAIAGRQPGREGAVTAPTADARCGTGYGSIIVVVISARSSRSSARPPTKIHAITRGVSPPCPRRSATRDDR